LKSTLIILRLLPLPFLLSQVAVGQVENIPLNKTVEAIYEQGIYSPTNRTVHTSIRPLLKRETDTSGGYGVVLPVTEKEITNRPVFFAEKGGRRIAITPLLTVLPTISFDRSNPPKDDALLIMNGLNLTAVSGRKWALSGNYQYNSSFYTFDEEEKIDRSNAISGVGKTRRLNGLGDYSNSYWNAYLSYVPNTTFHFQLGHGAHFFGDGYRSLLLSDHSGPYPYLKITTNFWKISYVNLFSMHYNYEDARNRFSQYDQKYNSTHYLSIKVGKRLNVSLFESVVWAARDSSNQRNFDVNYANPVIFYRPTEYSLGSPDNVLLGLNLSYKLGSRYVLYSQLLIDEFLLGELRAGDGWWANKFAVQAGAKAFYGRFKVQGEVNLARPFTYTHGNATQSYTHNNLPLSHPAGANFKEGVAVVRYTQNKTILESKVTILQYGYSANEKNVGQEVLLPSGTRDGDYGYAIGNGRKEELITIDNSISYLINGINGLMLTAGVRNWRSESRFARTDTYFYFGIRAGLFNQYNDY
jgi:hypothetical protein